MAAGRLNPKLKFINFLIFSSKVSSRLSTIAWQCRRAAWKIRALSQMWCKKYWYSSITTKCTWQKGVDEEQWTLSTVKYWDWNVWELIIGLLDDSWCKNWWGWWGHDTQCCWHEWIAYETSTLSGGGLSSTLRMCLLWVAIIAHSNRNLDWLNRQWPRAPSKFDQGPWYIKVSTECFYKGQYIITCMSILNSANSTAFAK